MNIEEYILSHALYLGNSIKIAPNIPDDVLEGCMKYFVEDISKDYILVAGDATVFGLFDTKCSTGFAFTGDRLFFANEENQKEVIQLADIKHVVYVKSNPNNSDDTYHLDDEVVIDLRNNNSSISLKECMVGFDCKAMELMLNGIAKLVDSGEEIQITKQNVPVSALDDDAKLLYIKLLCNYAYIGDGIIDSNEYSTIQNIIVRIGVRAELRVELRNYMTEIANREKSGNLLSKLKKSMGYGSFRIAQYSLVQDVLYLHNLTNPDVSWDKDGFIGSLINFLHISPEQIGLMTKAVILNKKMVADDSNIMDLQDDAKEIALDARDLGIPLMSLYCSGSVYSVDTYFAIFKGKEKAQIAIDKQRELMLQTVIKNTQKTINNLVEDMNWVTDQLVMEIKKGQQSFSRIEKLSALLSRLSKGTKSSLKENEDTKQRADFMRLPQEIDIARFGRFNLNKQEQCDFIRKFYKTDIKSGKMFLQRELIKDNADQIVAAFNDISY